MKTRACILLGLFLSVALVQAQSVSHYFVQMPAEMIPTIPTETRKDLIDFFKNGKLAVMPAAFGGQIVLKELSEDYILLQTSENADLQLKILQVNDSLRVLALVQSVSAPLRDSRIRFYSTLWQPLTNLVFPSFTALDFLDMEKANALNISHRLPEITSRCFLSILFKPDVPEVVVASSIPRDLSPENRTTFEPILKDSLTCVWNAGRFNLK